MIQDVIDGNITSKRKQKKLMENRPSISIKIEVTFVSASNNSKNTKTKDSH